jgi:hypothetical protein
VRPEGLGQLKKKYDIGNRTRYLPTGISTSTYIIERQGQNHVLQISAAWKICKNTFLQHGQNIKNNIYLTKKVFEELNREHAALKSFRSCGEFYLSTFGLLANPVP